MDFTLTEEQKLLRNEAHDFLSQEWPAATRRQMLDDGTAAAQEIWHKIADLGWPGLAIPEKFGGLASETLDLALLMEEMGRRLTPGTFFSTAALAAPALQRLGTDQAKQEYLPAIAEGRLRATLGLGVYEKESSWDLKRLQSISGTGDRLVKRFVPDAGAVDVIFCVVRDSENDVRLVVSTKPEVGCLNSIDPTRALAEVAFNPSETRTVGQGSLSALQSALDFATVALSAEMVGGAADALDATVEYVKARQQFGRPVGSFQAVQHRAADMLIELERARSMVYYAAIVADEQPERLALASSMAKVAANHAYRFISQQAIQLHGGIGFTWEQDLHLYLKRAKWSEFTLGDTAWHLDRIAGELGLPCP